MRGKKVYHLETSYDELLSFKDGLRVTMGIATKDGNHNTAQRIGHLLNKLELIMRR